MSYIEVKTSVNEYTNTTYYRKFKIVDELPEVGDAICPQDTHVSAVRPCRIDCEQQRLEITFYDYFEVDEMKDDPEDRAYPDEVFDTIYLAVPNGTEDLIYEDVEDDEDFDINH